MLIALLSHCRGILCKIMLCKFTHCSVSFRKVVLSALALCLIGAANVGLSLTALSQPLTGSSSVITIPVAYVPPDGTVTLGGGFVHKKYVDYDIGPHHNALYFGSIVFLPFLEVSYRFSRPLVDVPFALGDRSANVRAQLLAERGHRPAILVGAHDILRTTVGQSNYSNALYVVASKSFRPSPKLPRLSLHAGYGTDWISAQNRNFVGVFGGLSVSPLHGYELLLEYDGNIFSVGQRIRVLDRIELLTALQNFIAFSGGVAFSFSL